MAQENRRVRMTKKLLNNSLLHFLETKTVNKVTVTEICEEADVNRSTYYAHFTDPYQQLKSMEESIFSELHEKVDKNAPASLSSEEDVRRMIRRVLTFIKPYRKVIRILYRNGAVDLGEDMLEFFGRPYYKESHKPYDTYIYSYMFISNGMAALIKYWILNDDAPTEDQLTEMLVQFVMPHVRLINENVNRLGDNF